MSGVPEFLQDEFTQDEWNNLTDAEQAGMMEDGDGSDQQTPEEIEQEAAADKVREEAARAAAAPQKTAEELAAAAANPDKTAEELAAAAEPQQVVTPRPRGVIEASLPEDYDARVTANETAQAENEKKYDDGDLTFSEFRKEERKLNRESRDLDELKLRAELSQESSQQALINHWQGLMTPFLDRHPELGEDDVSKTGFDTYLKAVTGPVMQAGGTPGQAEIDKAYGLWCKRFNFTPTAEQQQAQTKAKREIIAPPTLGNLPAATGNAVEDGKWAAIDRLEGVAYEEALSKLSTAELDAYSQR